MLRYRIPVIGPFLWRRNMRRLGRQIGEAFRRGIEQAEPLDWR